jgi:hypothetical protein
MRKLATKSKGAPAVAVQPTVRRWRKARPRSGGWWLWREGGRDRIDKLLLTAGGNEVATDDEWEQATGKPAEHDGWVENYWEMTPTQKEMPGLWMKAPNDLGQQRKEGDVKMKAIEMPTYPIKDQLTIPEIN